MKLTEEMIDVAHELELLSIKFRTLYYREYGYDRHVYIVNNEINRGIFFVEGDLSKEFIEIIENK